MFVVFDRNDMLIRTKNRTMYNIILRFGRISKIIITNMLGLFHSSYPDTREAGLRIINQILEISLETKVVVEMKS